MQNSKIGWTHHTWNPWEGCNRVSEACCHCYIERWVKLHRRDPFNGPVKTITTWDEPFSWNDDAAGIGESRRVFTCSLSDFFHPGADLWRDEAWEIIRSCTNLDWLILTKRAELIRDHLPSDWENGYPNVWLGVTVENQAQLKRVDLLAKIPAAIRFVSAEPLLGPVRFGRRLTQLDWVITGCEQAGKDKRRPMDTDWVRNIRDECNVAGVALFHKQYYEGTTLTYDGLLDGEVHQDWPQSAA